MKVVKKLLKISVLYLLFGLIIAMVLCGGYREYVINQTLGAVHAQSRIATMDTINNLQ